MIPAFVLDEGLIRWGDAEVRLTAHQAAILGILRKRRPQWMPFERIAMTVWSYGERPAWARRSMRVQIFLIRRKLAAAGLPIKIESRLGEGGYRFVGDLEVM